MGGTPINYALVILILLFGLLGDVAPVFAGGRDTYIEVGGIPKSQKGGEGSSGSELYRRIENSLPGGGSSALGDPVKRLDGAPANRGGWLVPDTGRRPGESLSGGGAKALPYSGGLVDKPQTGSGATTIPWSNSGTFQYESTTLEQPSNQLCSSTDVTIGPDTQSRLHCSNTVGGTLKQ